MIMNSTFQGLKHSMDGQTTLCLMDPMTHTSERYVEYISALSVTQTPKSPSDSGIGDCGMEGIRDFLQSHTCNDICRKLELVAINDIQASIESQQDPLFGTSSDLDD